MVLGQLETHKQKNEVGPQPDIIHKNQKEAYIFMTWD